MPSDMNVRSLISKFEQLTTEIRQTNFKSTEDLLEPKTPTIAKAAVKFVYTPGQKSSYARLADIEQKVEGIHDQIVNLTEVTNEDFIRILFGLLNLLIDLGSIDTDGVQNLKQKKELCFREITGCKEELLKCMGEQFVEVQKPDVPISNGANGEVLKPDVSNGEDVESSEESLEEDIETPPATFVSVAKLKNIWEKSAEDLRSRNIFRNSISLSVESETEGVVEAGYLRSISDIGQSNEREVDSKDIEDSDEEDDFHSLPPHELKSVKDMRSIFEGSNREFKQNSMKVDNVLERQKSLMNTLLEEVEYYKNVAKNEVVEENLVGLYLELNKFDTLNDPGLAEMKSKAIEIVNSLQADFETNSEENLKEGHDEDFVKQLNDLCLEVDRYKDLVNNLDPKDRVFVEVLEQNIQEVLEQLDKLPVVTDLGYKKIRAIRDLSALLSKVEAAQEDDPYEVLVTAQEKLPEYRRRVEELDLSDKEAAQTLSNDIQVDLDKLCEFEVAPENEHRKNEIDKLYCKILFNLHKKQAGPYFAVCPPYIPSNEHNDKEHQENDQAYISSSEHNEKDHQENDQPSSEHNDKDKDQENDQANPIPSNAKDEEDTNKDVLIEADTTTIVPKDQQMNDHTESEQIVEDKNEVNNNGNKMVNTFDQLSDELTIVPKEEKEEMPGNEIDQLCPIVPKINDQTRLEQIHEEENYDTLEHQKVDTAFDQLYDELTIVPNDSKTVQNFDELLKQEDTEESARIFDASAALDDLALKVGASQKVVETLSILDKDDTEKFRRNIEDVKGALYGLDTLGDAALEVKKRSILENVTAIEEKLEVATNEVD